MDSTISQPNIITIIGSLNTDLTTITSRVPSSGETITASGFTTGAGGKGANQAVACARLSRDNVSNVVVKMVGAVGSDSFGTDLIAGLIDNCVDTSGIRVVEGQVTGVAVILVEETTGDNRILLNPGANHTLQAADFLTKESLGSPQPRLIILQLEIPVSTIVQIMKIAKEAGIPVLLNPAPAVKLPEEVFQDLEHLILNETEAAIMLGADITTFESSSMDWSRVTDEFLSKGVRNVIVTLGGNGAFFSNKLGGGHRMPAAKVSKIVDTTAAGDTFIGAYAVKAVRASIKSPETSGYSQYEVGEWIQLAVKYACDAAGKTVERAGAQAAIPWSEEVPQSQSI